MRRLTISLDDGTAAARDAFMAARGDDNRFEAVRDPLRAGLRETPGTRPCPARRRCCTKPACVSAP
jgi:CopG family nickel-responsive transcriptional regulator